MRTGAVRLGEFLIFIGVFVLALQYIDWSAFAPIERADLVIAGGVVLLICFAGGLWSRSVLLDELIHLIALIIGAIVLGLLVSSADVSTWVDVAGPVRAEKTLSFDGTFDPAAPTLSVTLELQNGTATVQTWEKESFQITITARARGWKRLEAQRLITSVTLEPQLSPTGIVFRAPRISLGRFSSLETDVQLLVPRGRVYELKLNTINGALNVEEINAMQAELSTSNGYITLTMLTAQQLTAHTLNGEISGELAAAEASLSTTNGDIKLTLRAVTGSYKLSTFNGSMTLDVPDDPTIGYAISAQSTIGHVHVEIPNFDFRRQERHSVEGETSNFQTAPTKITIIASTTNGEIEIR